MKYSARDRSVCLSLYMVGNTLRQIQQKTNVSVEALSDWIVKYKWDSINQSLQDKLTEKAVDSLAEYKMQFIDKLEIEIKNIQSKIELSKNPTSDKLYHVWVECQKLLLSLKGIQFDQKQINVEHSGNVTVKLEDLV